VKGGRGVFERGARVIITGATSGIGAEAARQLGARGCRVAVTGRREEKLRATEAAVRAAGAEDVIALAGSVTDPATVRRHVAAVCDAWGGVDVAILNAGVGDSEHARRFTAANQRWHFETNVFGVCNWLEVLIPLMLEARSGVIAGVSSPAGWRGMPASGAYSASKAAVSTLLESVRVDLRGTGISIVTVCPGFVKSELTDRNDPRDMPYVLSAEDGVRRMLRGIEKRRRLVHFPRRLLWPLRYGIALMPPWLYDLVASRVIRRAKAPYDDPERDRHPEGRCSVDPPHRLREDSSCAPDGER